MVPAGTKHKVEKIPAILTKKTRSQLLHFVNSLIRKINPFIVSVTFVFKKNTSKFLFPNCKPQTSSHNVRFHLKKSVTVFVAILELKKQPKDNLYLEYKLIHQCYR